MQRWFLYCAWDGTNNVLTWTKNDPLNSAWSKNDTGSPISLRIWTQTYAGVQIPNPKGFTACVGAIDTNTPRRARSLMAVATQTDDGRVVHRNLAQLAYQRGRIRPYYTSDLSGSGFITAPFLIPDSHIDSITSSSVALFLLDAVVADTPPDATEVIDPFGVYIDVYQVDSEPQPTPTPGRGGKGGITAEQSYKMWRSHGRTN